MDDDFDLNLAPSGDIYGARAIMLDPANPSACYQGGLNAVCMGITPQQSEQAPGLVGNQEPPFLLAQAGTNFKVPAYGQGRMCLWDVDITWVGQIRPNDLLICGNAGQCRRASPFGPWNQWILAMSFSFASPGQSANVKIIGPFPWSPTGS